MKTVLLKILILFTVLALADARDYGTHINAQANAQSLPSRKVVRKEGDLPLFTYPVTGSARALLTSDDATFNAFARNVRSDLESLLRDYDIQNKDVLIQLLSHKLDLQMLSGEDSEALKTCEQMRSLFDQPDLKAAGILTDLTLLHARMVTGQSSGAQFQAEYEKSFRSLVESLPWNVVSERIKNRKAKFEKLSIEYVKERVETEIEPYLGKNHALDFPMATRLIYWRGELLNEVPQRQIVLDILSAYMKEHDALGPAAAPIRPVADDYFGTKIVDNYRYMENLKDPEVQQWMKEQADNTRAVLDSLPGRAALLARINELTQMQQVIVTDVQIVAGHYYSQRTTSGSQVAGLYVRDGLNGTDRLLINPEKDSGPGGTHFSISFYAPSPDNHYVVYGLSAGGSGNAVLHVVDVASGKDIGEIIDRARYAHPSWRDGRSFFYTQLQPVTPDMTEAARYQKSVSRLHVVGTDPNSDPTILGFGVNPTIPLAPEEIPTVYAAPGTNYAVAVIRRGVEERRRVYVAPLGAATGPDIHWKPIAANYDEGIIAWKPASAGALPTHGDTLYLISRRDNPNGEIVSFDLSKPAPATPITILPSGKLPIEAIQCAKDAIYIQLMDGGAGRLAHLAFARSPSPVAVGLPFSAAVRDVSTDPVTGGAVLFVTAWTRPRTYLHIEPDAGHARDAGLQPPSPLDSADDFEIEEVKVKSWDGTEIPLSIRFKKGLVLDGSHPTWLLGYGAYGYPRTPAFNPIWRAALEQGVIFADAHVRGGGDYGEAWHLGGYKLTKPNTWRDFIACAEYLVAHHYTSPSKLFGVGASGGGILIGRAIEERPDLFAAAALEVPIVDLLRFETTQNGGGHVPEFGSVKTQEGFEDLYAMSPYAHVRDGVKYPAVLVTTAINDNTVAPWLPAKFAARLQAATASGKPVLLRVDYDSGHLGTGATISQVAATFADIISFALWQTGDPDFQPKKHP